MRTVRLDEFMPRRLGSVNPAKFTQETFELWSVPSFDKGEPEVLLGSEIGSSKKIVEKGDLLLSRIVPHIRRAWIVDPTTDNRQIGSSEWITFRSNDFHAPYLRHILVSDKFNSQLMQTVAGVGGSLLRARPESVRDIEIPLPPLPEQKRIAGILDQADALRQKRQQALDHLNQLGQSIFYEMFGDPAVNPEKWPIGTIRQLVNEAKYGTSKKANTKCKGMPILRMGNITYDGQIDLSDLKYVEFSEVEFPKYTTKIGDILFNRTNSKELVGKTAVVRQNEPLAIAGYLVRARTNSLANPHYISGYLNSQHGKLTLTKMCNNIVGMANINAQKFQDIKIAIPPVERQNLYAERLDEIEIRKSNHHAASAISKKLFMSLQQRAFRGEL